MRILILKIYRNNFISGVKILKSLINLPDQNLVV